MRNLHPVCACLLLAVCARADFSYTSTRKSTGGMMNSPAMSGTTKTFLKGQKMKVETGDTSLIFDFDAQTVTTVNTARKTYGVRKFSEMGSEVSTLGTDIHADVRPTGQKKKVNGYDASEVVTTVQADMGQGRGAIGKMQVDIDVWVSPDVPGAAELKSFYQRNAGRMPWGALATGANSSLQQAMTDLQKKMATMDGVPVQQIIRITSPGVAAQLQNAQPALAKARAQMEAMIAKGGPQAEAARKAMAAMGMSGGDSAPGSPLAEITMDSGDFSTASVPASVFAIPAEYTETPAAH